MAIFAKLKEKLFGAKNNSKYNQGLKKSRLSFTEKFKSLSSKYQVVNQEYFNELEEVLISSDVGYKMSLKIIDEIEKEVKKNKISKPSEINEIILDKMFSIYTNNEVVSTKLNFNKNGLTCFLIVGVNGSGKTTTIAKLAYKLKNINKKTLMIAADTFRAGAVEQLNLWSKKLDVAIQQPIKLNQDPASVVFQGIERALKEDYDVALVDTAGRLENKVNLMQEITKINKIITKKLNRELDEILLVLDASTGQNGIVQAQEFANIIPITSIVLTKMDGSAKGGIILSIKEYLDLPVKLIGLGEQAQDLEEFDLEQYLYNLTKDLFQGDSLEANE